MWTPRLRWTAEQSMQRKIPYGTDAQVGFFALQSKHDWNKKQNKKKHHNFKNQKNVHTNIADLKRDLENRRTKLNNWNHRSAKVQNIYIYTKERRTLFSDLVLSFLNTAFLSVKPSEAIEIWQWKVKRKRREKWKVKLNYYCNLIVENM